MINPIINAIEQEHMRKEDTVNFPKYNIGDTIKVFFKIQEGAKFRIQAYEGVVIKKKGGGINETFTVRRIGANNMALERIFPLHSPLIEKIQLVRPGRVRRAKLYYLRERTGKAARIKEKLKRR